MARDAAVIVNNEDASLVLPRFYLSKADEDAKTDPQKITLGAACDRGVVKSAQPEAGLNAYSFQRLKDHKIIKALVAKRAIEFRAPGLVLDIGT